MGRWRQFEPIRSNGDDVESQMRRRRVTAVEAFKDHTDISIGESSHHGSHDSRDFVFLVGSCVSERGCCRGSELRNEKSDGDPAGRAA